MRSMKMKEMVKFRISKLDKKVLERKAKLAGLSVSEFCRRAAFDVEIKSRLSEDEVTFYRALINISNSFTRMANFFKSRNMKSLVEECLATSSLVKAHLEKFK